jgi:hypothetical protein
MEGNLNLFWFSKQRTTFEKSLHLYKDAWVYSEKFKGYLRMSEEKCYAKFHVCGPGTKSTENVYCELNCSEGGADYVGQNINFIITLPFCEHS